MLGGVMIKNHKVVLGLFIAILMVSSIGFFNSSSAADKKEQSKGDSEMEKLKNTRAVIETKYGKIELKFYPQAAPNHVKNFTNLAREGFYDGTIFHRVIPGFMIQGGDPNTKGLNKNIYGAGGPGYNVKAEFNNISHKTGMSSMATATPSDSAGSQ